MKIDFIPVRKCLKAFDFNTLFREHLGWDNFHTNLDIQVNGTNFSLQAIAQKRGFAAYLSPFIPERPIRLKLDHQLTKSSREHLIIYADQATGQQVWQWIRREPGKPLACREHRFDAHQSGDALIQRLEQLAVSLDEEEQITIVDVTGRARAAFDVDRVTKKFYDRFKAEHAAFLKFIKGIAEKADLEWYTSLMLNRLMFVYFIQKKGFLDGDLDYLRNRLHRMRELKGKDQFQSFYRSFLLALFHDGLGKSPADRKLDPVIKQLLGHIPYLNGGFFEVHQLETNNPEIDIPDKAFEKLFDFFDQYSWHLDERPLRADNEINPDVVGYIFEKYINQKQMGAYYTKEDITEYISKNTIIPFLFDAAEKKCAIAFKPDSALWRLLQDDPDRYIYAAVRHGVIDEKGGIIPLPKDIEAGVKSVAQREGWNKSAPDPYALPTETWREHVARRQRCLEIREKLRKGEVHQINDLITLNLDIWQFARDAIVNAEGPELLRAFWHVITSMTILDPTCGSGAFLFAALCIMESLYSDCLERMARFVEDADSKGEKANHQKYSDFRDILAQIAKHPNERYFILKSIIINNLFGVDIMEEATEICKLRLFLKLVAQVEKVEQIEPLPDMDFNIRAGNTLVGFASMEQVKKSMQGDMIKLLELPRIEESAEIAARAFQQFRAQQTKHGGKVTAEDKQDLRQQLAKLDAELDRFLASEYGVDVSKPDKFKAWKASHQPFHWLVEFYNIIHNGGFDVIIGNPPYVAKGKISYSLAAFSRLSMPDIYGYCMLRVNQLKHAAGFVGLIVPLSITFSEDFSDLRDVLFSKSQSWISSFDNIPASLFDGVSQRCTICLYCASNHRVTHVTRMYRWCAVYRPYLFKLLEHVCIVSSSSVVTLPKLVSSSFLHIIELISASQHLLPKRSSHAIGFSQAARNFLSAFVEEPPCLDDSTLAHVGSSKRSFISVSTSEQSFGGFVMLCGELSFLHWLVIGDGFDVTRGNLVPILRSVFALPNIGHLADLGRLLHQRRYESLSFKRNAGIYVGNYNYKNMKAITRRADLLFMAQLGIDKNSALSVFDWVQRILSINVLAGEKGIPDCVRSKYKPLAFSSDAQSALFSSVDSQLKQHYGFTDEELDFIINEDMNDRIGQSGENVKFLDCVDSER